MAAHTGGRRCGSRNRLDCVAGTVCSGAGAPTAHCHCQGSLSPRMLCLAATGQHHGVIATCSVQWGVVCRYINLCFVSQLTMHWRAAIVDTHGRHLTQQCHCRVPLGFSALRSIGLIQSTRCVRISSALSRTQGLCSNVAESGCCNLAIGILKWFTVHACMPGTHIRCQYNANPMCSIVGDVLLLHGIRPIFCR
jgi:hypothetical protein